MYRNLGGWTFAFDDYLDVNITAELDSEGVAKMAAIIDPLCNLFIIEHFYILPFNILIIYVIKEMIKTLIGIKILIALLTILVCLRCQRIFFYNVSAYNDRYKNIAKFIITTGGDEFFQPDDAHYYFDQLEGPKYLRCNHVVLE